MIICAKHRDTGKFVGAIAATDLVDDIINEKLLINNKNNSDSITE
jgi:hypothetical protein